MREKLFYTAFGLRIRSEVRLPLTEMSDLSEQVDVWIRLESAPFDDAKKNLKPFNYEVSDHQSILCFIPHVATFEITLPGEIKIFPAKEMQAEAISLFLLGSALGVILHYQEGAVLHGSAVKYENMAIIFTGQSGVGKSTLATAFSQIGCPILTDDVALVKFDRDRRYVVPSYPQVKLWSSSLESLEIPTTNLKPIFSRLDKFSIPFARSFERNPQDLKAIFVLKTHSLSVSRSVRFEKVEGGRVYVELHNNTYRVEFLSQMGNPKKHFHSCVRLAQQTPVYYLSRPETGVSARQIAEECLRFLNAQRRQKNESYSIEQYSEAQSTPSF